MKTTRSPKTSRLLPVSERIAISATEAAGILGISGTTCLEMIHTGKIPAVQFGRRLLVSVEVLREMLKQGNVYKGEGG
jgi:excisionase family DNA binding protein